MTLCGTLLPLWLALPLGMLKWFGAAVIVAAAIGARRAGRRRGVRLDSGHGPRPLGVATRVVYRERRQPGRYLEGVVVRIVNDICLRVRWDDGRETNVYAADLRRAP